jgi:hypothetical protein
MTPFRICREETPTTLNGGIAADLAFSVTPSQWFWCRNINLLAIDYTFRSRLRNRLTLSRLT